MKGGDRDVWGTCKNVRALRVSFLNWKSIQTKDFQKVSQNRLYTTTKNRFF